MVEVGDLDPLVDVLVGEVPDPGRAIGQDQGRAEDRRGRGAVTPPSQRSTSRAPRRAASVASRGPKAVAVLARRDVARGDQPIAVPAGDHADLDLVPAIGELDHGPIGFEHQQAGRRIERLGRLARPLGLPDRRRLGRPDRRARRGRTPAGSSRGRPPAPSTRPAARPPPDSRSSPPAAPASPAAPRWSAADSPPPASSRPRSSRGGSARTVYHGRSIVTAPHCVSTCRGRSWCGCHLPPAARTGRPRLPHARRQPARRHLDHRLQQRRQHLPHPLQHRRLVLLQPAIPTFLTPRRQTLRQLRHGCYDLLGDRSRHLRAVLSAAGAATHRRPSALARHDTPSTRSTEVSHTPPSRKS